MIRRGFFGALGCLFAAPFVAKAVVPPRGVWAAARADLARHAAAIKAARGVRHAIIIDQYASYPGDMLHLTLVDTQVVSEFRSTPRRRPNVFLPPLAPPTLTLTPLTEGVGGGLT